MQEVGVGENVTGHSVCHETLKSFVTSGMARMEERSKAAHAKPAYAAPDVSGARSMRHPPQFRQGHGASLFTGE